MDGQADEETISVHRLGDAMKRDRFAQKKTRTRRIDGVDVHAAKGQPLEFDLEVIESAQKLFPDWDGERLKSFFNGIEGRHQQIAKFVRTKANK